MIMGWNDIWFVIEIGERRENMIVLWDRMGSGCVLVRIRCGVEWVEGMEMIVRGF